MILTTCKNCGTHWLSGMLHLLSGLGSRGIYGSQFTRLREALAAQDQKGEALHFGHIPLELLAPLVDEHPIVCLVRDRRDAIVSRAWRQVRRKSVEYLDRELASLWRKGGDHGMVPWWDSYTEWHERIPHLLIRYEDLLVDTEQILVRAWDYCGLSALSGRPMPSRSAIAGVIKHCEDGVSLSHPKRRAMFGEWREHYTSDEGAAFYDEYMANTSHLGYPRE